MNTDDLIDFLSTRVEAVDPRRQDRILIAGILCAFALSLASSVSMLGVRPDLAGVLASSPGLFLKLGFIASLGMIAALGLSSATRAGNARPGVLRLVLLPLAIVWLAAAIELLGTPAAALKGTILAPDWQMCLMAIPTLSIFPFVILTRALRTGAPTQLPYCGALLGLLSGSIGALAYASFCIHDTPVYVGLWYATAIAGVTVAGWLAGPRLLRW